MHPLIWLYKARQRLSRQPTSKINIIWLIAWVNIHGRLLTVQLRWCICVSWWFVHVPLHIIHMFACCIYCSKHLWQDIRKSQTGWDEILFDPLSYENLCKLETSTGALSPEQPSPDSRDFNHYAELVTTSLPLFCSWEPPNTVVLIY